MLQSKRRSRNHVKLKVDADAQKGATTPVPYVTMPVFTVYWQQRT